MSELERPYDEAFESRAIDFADLVLGGSGLRVKVGRRGERNRFLDTLEGRRFELIELAHNETLAGFHSEQADGARELLLETVRDEDRRDLLSLEGSTANTSDEAETTRMIAVQKLRRSNKFKLTEGLPRLVTPLEDEELQLLKAGLLGGSGLTSDSVRRLRLMAILAEEHHPDLTEPLLKSIVGMEAAQESGLRQEIFKMIANRAGTVTQRMLEIERGLDWTGALTTVDFLKRDFRSTDSPPLAPYGGVVPQLLLELQAELETQHRIFASIVTSEAGIIDASYRELAMRRVGGLGRFGGFDTLHSDEMRIGTVRDNIVGFDAIFAPSLKFVYDGARMLCLRKERRVLQRGFCLGLRGLPFGTAQPLRQTVSDQLDHSSGDDAYWYSDVLDSIQGDDSDGAWAHRETCVERYSQIPWIMGSVACSLAGLQSDRAWVLRRELRGEVQPEQLLLSINNAVIATLRAQGRFEQASVDVLH